MSNNSNVPQIRFKGFTEDWEQRKLGEIGSVSMCRRIFKEQTSETGDIPFYKIGTFGAEPDAFISRELFEEYKSKYPYPKKGDILISASGSIGRTVEFAGNNEYFQDSNIVWLSHDERLSNSFLKCFYSVVKWAGIEGSTIKRLYNDNILNTVICMPSVPEQERIGLFFENLDNLITLHQRKYDKLVNIKKALLERMFPQAGETAPAIRFKGFTDAWEQRKLLEYFTKYQNTVYLDDNEKYIQVSIRNTGIVEYRDTKRGAYIGRKRQYMVDTKTYPLTLTFTRQTVYEGGIGFVPESLNGAIVTENMPLLAMKNADKNFITAFVRTVHYYTKVIDDNTLIGSAQKALHENLWLNSEVLIPELKEQVKIGNLFSKLDNLITLHQRKLEKLKNIKSALLEKMFVS